MSDDKAHSPQAVVGRAIYEALREDGDLTWHQLTVSEQENFGSIAEHATQAHLEWMTAAGFRIAPPGTMLRPKSEGDAKAMVLAAQDFLKTNSKKALIGSPKLIVPHGVKH